MDEIFRFLDDRIDVAMLHLEDNDSDYDRIFNKLNVTASELFNYYDDGGEGIPKEYEERIQYFFENAQDIDVIRLRAVYFAAVVDCLNMLSQLGYLNI